MDDDQTDDIVTVYGRDGRVVWQGPATPPLDRFDAIETMGVTTSDDPVEDPW